MDLKVGSGVHTTAFFVVDATANYNAFLNHDWIHSMRCVPSSFQQKLMLWNGNTPEVILADPRPFAINSLEVKGRYYDEDVDLICFVDCNAFGRLTRVSDTE